VNGILLDEEIKTMELDRYDCPTCGGTGADPTKSCFALEYVETAPLPCIADLDKEVEDVSHLHFVIALEEKTTLMDLYAKGPTRYSSAEITDRDTGDLLCECREPTTTLDYALTMNPQKYQLYLKMIGEEPGHPSVKRGVTIDAPLELGASRRLVRSRKNLCVRVFFSEPIALEDRDKYRLAVKVAHRVSISESKTSTIASE
jgi:hypothetical protein